MKEQVSLAQIVAELKAWYQSRYGVRLTNYKLALQVQQRIHRPTYFRTISAIEAGRMPAWDVGNALQEIRLEWISCKSTVVVDDSQMTEA